jgi:hypothetical protein
MVFRAHDRLAGQDVALKSMLRPGSQSDVQSDTGSVEDRIKRLVEVSSRGMWSREIAKLTLVHEFRTLSSLRHPNIVAVLDYGVDASGMPYITEELVTSSRTLLKAMKDEPLPDKIRVLAQILRALSFLHRRHITHCDLKPANILILSQGRQAEAKLIDFGLAQHLRDPSGLGSIVGTPGYIAPELLAGVPASAASDLFALGVTATELICGHAPFQGAAESMTRAPDLSLPSDSSELRKVLLRLLNPNPELRYQSAAHVLQDVADYCGEPLTVETHVTRGYLLQQTPLIGREPELLHLEQMLAAAQAGCGAFAVVYGESGIGKSRLVEELRCHALVSNFLVVHAQAQSEGAYPLHLWREPLRALCVYSVVDDETEKTLRTQLPDLEQLLGRPLISTSPVEPIGTPHRLASATVTLIERVTRPLLLILEDLHLADPASLELLHILTERLAQRSTLIVGTYRCVDSVSGSSQFPSAQLLHLRPLQRPAQEALTAALIGTAAKRAALRELIYQDAGGHPLFVKEVLRELLTQFGSVENLMCASLPSRVSSGGILAVIRQRIARMPAQFKELLNYTALAGRQLDIPLLNVVAQSQRVDLSSFIGVGQELGILENFDREWRFSHDLLHEEVCAALGPEQCERLHLAIARSLLTAYPGSTEHSSRLAFHFEAANRPVEAVCHHLRAAEHALQIDAAKTALDHVDRILRLLPDDAMPSLTELSCQRLIAHANYLLARFYDCVQALSAAESSLAKLRGRLRVRQSVDSFTGRVLDREQLNAEEILMLRAGESYVWVGQRMTFVRRTVCAFPRLYREPRMPGMLCFFLGMLVAEVGALGPAVRFIDLGQQVHRLRGFEIGVFEAYRIRATLQIRQGKWNLVERDLDALIQWGHQHGSLFRTIQAVFMRFTLHLSCNRLGLAEQTAAQLRVETERSGIEEYLLGSALAEARIAFRRGNCSSALERLERAQKHSGRPKESALWSSYSALFACILARCGDVSAFLAAVQAAAAALTPHTAGTVWDGDLHILLVWELFTLLPKCPQHALAISSLISQLEKGPLHRLRAVPIAAPGLEIIKFAKTNVLGEPKRAESHLRKAIALAQKLQMPYEEAWASLSLSRQASVQASEQCESLRRFAQRISAQSGCVLPLPSE